MSAQEIRSQKNERDWGARRAERLRGQGERLRGGARDCLRAGRVEHSAAMRDVCFNCVLRREIMRDIAELPASYWFPAG